MTEAVLLSLAFVLGMMARGTGLPPLIGYLVAGFVAFKFSAEIGVSSTVTNNIEHLAHIGILLLLFTVGLKIDLKKLVKMEVIGTSVLHVVISIIMFVPIAHFVMGFDLATAFAIAIILSFSSTVLSAKILDNKGELKAFHGKVVIGILIIQDIIALGTLSVMSGTAPSPWAALLVLFIALRPIFHWALSKIGHDELVIVYGVALAVVCGAVFSSLGLSSELGALAAGVLLAGHSRTNEISNKLWSVKELFLVGFFLSIGMNGLPRCEDWLFAITVAVLIPLQALSAFFLLVFFKLKARSAFLSALALANYSEFGLIISSAVMPELTVPLALSVAISFLISAPLNRYAHPIFGKLERHLVKFERNVRHPDETPIALGNADVIIIGMGMVGSSVYENLESRFSLIGFDSDDDCIKEKASEGKNVIYTDAEGPHFWSNIDLRNIQACILCLPSIEAKVHATRHLRDAGFKGIINAYLLHADEAKDIISAGADVTYLAAKEAGKGMAVHTIESLKK